VSDLQRALVVENNDPEYRGRIKVRLATQSASVPISELNWAEYISPFGGGDHVDGAGFFFVPEIGQQVYVINEAGNSNKLLYIGASFYNEGGLQVAPISTRFQEGFLNRSIRTRGGNRLELDDRIHGSASSLSTFGVRLLDGKDNGLDVTASTGIRLGFGQSTGQLKITSKGAKFVSNKNAGIFINDELESIRIRTPQETASLALVNDNVNLYADKDITLISNTMHLFPQRGLEITSAGGPIELKAGSGMKFISTNGINFQAGAEFNVNANQINFTGQLGSNYQLDLPVFGDGSLSGNIVMNTASGNVLFRNGLAVPLTPLPTFANATTTTLNDTTFGLPTFFGRMGLGITGNAILEGAKGGIFISGIPLPLPGTAGGLGGRLPLPLAPIVPTNVPGGPQSAVLGGNLFLMLSTQMTALNTLLGVMIANATQFSISPVGPTVINPVIAAALVAYQTTITALQQTHINPAPGLPTNILSSTVFVDG
jgi:hypothetical protein